MGKAILMAILKFIGVIISIIMIPFNAIVETLIPDLANFIQTFTNAINMYISNNIAWVFNIIPSNTRLLIIAMLTFTIAYYTATISIHIIVVIIDLAKRIREMFI